MRILSGLLPGHVLQRTPRGAAASLSGECAARGAVTASISRGGRPLPGWSAKRVGRAAAGRFTARLAGLPTGGPYALVLRVDDERSDACEFFVGDLWLMAGQSNMEGIGNMADAPRPHPLVRNFSMAHRWEVARDPLHHLGESPDLVHNGGSQQRPAEAAKAKRTKTKGVGVGVHFGIAMHRRSGVPQGLIATAHGGTSMAQWDPAKKDQAGASLYGSMLSSLHDVGQPIAGMLWYQGCSDANPAAAAVYTMRMEQLVDSVRRDLRQPALPWVVVQIGRLVGQPGGEREWNSVQEQERLLPRLIRHLDVVPAVDLELDDLIHVSGKAYALLGERMARVADRLAYGNRRESPAIQPQAARVLADHPHGPAIEVRFANVVGGLRSSGLPLGFSLVDGEHRVHETIYKVELDGDRAILFLTGNDRNDLRVMYGWGKNPRCNLVDGRGMAVPVSGPLRIAGQQPASRWFTAWDVSAIRAGERIERLPRPTVEAVGPVQRRLWDGNFTNQHDQWQGNPGHAAFFGEMTLAEAMRLELRLGYDGPIRVWIGGREVHRDLRGTNPAIADAHRIPVSLKAGRHPVTVLMALNGGMAWGFFLRFARRDLDTAAADSGSYAMPVPRI